MKLIEKRNNGTEPSINPFGRNVSCHFCLPRANGGVRPAPRGLTAYTIHTRLHHSRRRRRRHRGYRPRIYHGIYACAPLRSLLSIPIRQPLLFYILCTLCYYNYTVPHGAPFTLLIPAVRRRPRKTVSPSPSALLLLFTLSRNYSFSGSFLCYNTRATVNPLHAPPPRRR